MKRITILASLMMLFVASAVSAQPMVATQAGGDNLVSGPSLAGQMTDISAMISATSTITGKCPNINGQAVFVLIEDTRASVFFKSKGWVTGFLRAGDTVFIDSDGNILRAGRCGNPAKGQVRFPAPPAPEVVTGPQGPAGQNGCNGAPGAEGPQGLKGDKGDTGSPGTGITNYYFTSNPVMCGQIGGQSPYQSSTMQLMSVSLVPVSNTNISVSASATGGQGGQGGSANVVNNNSNANTNVNANNNVINVGSGSASGSATGTGTSTAGSGNH